MSALVLTISAPDADAKGKGLGKKVTEVSLIPAITEVALNDDGDLVASGHVSVVNKGKTSTVPFEDITIDINLAEDQTGAVDCPIVDVELGAFDLNLQGLLLEISPICVKITADDDEELGELFCDIGDLLEEDIPLDALDDLTDDQIEDLLPALEELLNDALENLEDAVLTDIEELRGRNCATLSLEYEPADLTLLGLDVSLDDCEGGPITVDITARRGQLLGNVLCGLLHKGRGGIDEGDTLGDILDDLLGDDSHHK